LYDVTVQSLFVLEAGGGLRKESAIREGLDFAVNPDDGCNNFAVVCGALNARAPLGGRCGESLRTDCIAKRPEIVVCLRGDNATAVEREAGTIGFLEVAGRRFDVGSLGGDVGAARLPVAAAAAGPAGSVTRNDDDNVAGCSGSSLSSSIGSA
jgi:hypothetical protein